MHPIRPAPLRHAGSEGSSRPVLRLRVGTAETRVAVIGRPVKLEMAVRTILRIIHCVLRLISRGIDECKRLAVYTILPPEEQRSGCPKHSSSATPPFRNSKTLELQHHRIIRTDNPEHLCLA